jgi:hypothetical protein
MLKLLIGMPFPRTPIPTLLQRLAGHRLSASERIFVAIVKKSRDLRAVTVTLSGDCRNQAISLIETKSTLWKAGFGMMNAIEM